MTFISDREIAELPEEPEQRFVALESIVRQRYEEAVEKVADGDSSVALMRRYMSIVLPAAKHYGIEGLLDWKQPAIGVDWDVYAAFLADVDFCITALRLRNIEQVGAHSVALNSDTKTKLTKMLGHIREFVSKLDISIAKKEALFNRINDLQAEIDRDRTRWQAFASLMIEACDDVGEAATKLEPVIRLIERVGGALGGAKRAEKAQPKLPPRTEPKKIESKKPRPPRRPIADDEIPF